MNKLRRLGPLAVATSIAAAVACGSSTDAGPQAASVTGIAGDSQTASTGAALAFPLSFVALGSNGQPAPGVHVTWSATPSSAATFNPPTSTTDVNGAASTTPTLGSVVGSITIHAAVPGVADVVYHATALDPCTYLTPLTLGQTVSDSLKATDCRRTFGTATYYYDYYKLSLPSGTQSVRISMHGTSTGFDDTYLDLFRASDGKFIAFDDDSILATAGARNSQLDIILPGTDYIIGASSYAASTTGPFTLTATVRPAAMNGCREVWVTRGESVADSITASACADSSATPHHYAVARIVLFAGTVLSIAERSTAMNPAFALYKVYPGNGYARTLAASNDDSSAGNPNAFIRYVVDTSNYFDVLISTSVAGATGAYTFDVLADTTLASPSRAPSVRRADLRDFLGSPRRAKH
jgi:hypothetical protein